MFSAIFPPNYWILFFSYIHIRFFRIQADFYLCGVLSVCISIHGSLCFFSSKKPFSDKKTAPANAWSGLFFGNFLYRKIQRRI